MLMLKFWIKASNGRVYVEVPAKVNAIGSYTDKEHVFTETGMIPRSMIEGEITEEWLTEDSGQETYPPLLFQK